MTTHILAMGGGGFSQSEGYLATPLDRYLVSLTDVRSPLVCFVPTGSGDNGVYISRFTNAYSHLQVRTCVLSLWEGAADSVQRMDEVDVFFVGGGSTINTLALWHVHGVTRKFRDIALDPDRNVVIGGMGAGASVWYQACTTDSFGRGVEPLTQGLGLLEGSFCPHYDSESERAPHFVEFVDTGALPDGWGADNGAAIHYIDGKPHAFLSERDGAVIHRVEQDENGATVTVAEMTRL